MYESALLDWDHRAHTGPASYDPRGVLRAHNTHFQRTGHMVAFRPHRADITVQACTTEQDYMHETYVCTYTR